MTTYTFERPTGCKADVDRFDTTDKIEFMRFLMDRTTEGIVRDVMELGIRFYLAEDNPDPLTELIERIMDGYFQGRSDIELLSDGLGVLEIDFLEYGREPDNLFDGISIRE